MSAVDVGELVCCAVEWSELVEAERFVVFEEASASVVLLNGIKTSFLVSGPGA